MKIAFFGSPETARLCLERILDAGHSVALVITQPDRPAGRGRRLRPSPVKRFSLERGIPVLEPARIRRDPDVLGALERSSPDINVVVAYGQIIPASIIYLPRFNSLNLHFSLLPHYRGAAPVQWALYRGESETGVTVFELNEKMDEGPILTQRPLPILPGENAPHLESRLADLGTELLLETIARIQTLKPVPQDHTMATYAPLLKKEDGRIDWTRPAESIDRQVRAFRPWPSVYAFLNRQRIKILAGLRLADTGYRGGDPGEIQAAGPEGLDVLCGGGSIYRIQILQPENKPAMPAHAFALGARLGPGQRFNGDGD